MANIKDAQDKLMGKKIVAVMDNGDDILKICVAPVGSTSGDEDTWMVITGDNLHCEVK